MCGIYCSFCQQNGPSGQLGFQETKMLLQNRGPDCYSELAVDCGWDGIFAGSTLWTQGLDIIRQPQISSNGSIFLWNGDKYEDCEDACAKKSNDADEVFSNILENGVQYLTGINGPYSFIYFDAEEKDLWFGRDVLGRHSLLWAVNRNVMEVSSVGLFSSPNVEEIPAYGFYKINFTSTSFCINVFPWYHLAIPKEINICLPFIIGQSLQHKLLSNVFGGHWIDMNPEDSQILQCPGPASEETADLVFREALDTPTFSCITECLKNILFNSVCRRIKTQPKFCKNCISSKDFCRHSKVGILFSGGLDSAVLALISNSFVDEDEPIDLLNVSFQRSLNHNYKDVPDRINGLNTLKELQKLCPLRNWNFIEINISQNELNTERKKHISKLINPLNTVLDESLGCALWFAARGRGLVKGSEYTSPSRIVLLGMGADEMFGGYTKHKKAFTTDGWKGLGLELCRTLCEISERNLGRDNRVVADHGRQPRTPYLDEQLVAFIDKLPPWQRCFLPPLMPAGLGDKFALRLVAWELGLRRAATLPKKALQFGSHIANPKEKGHLRSDRLSQP